MSEIKPSPTSESRGRGASVESVDSNGSDINNENPPGVLKCATLEKPHGLLGSYVKRYYVLTEDCLHRFERANSDMFFGKEIAHYDLTFITNLKVVDHTIKFELKTKGQRKIRCPEGPQQAEDWVVAIKKAKKSLEIRRRDSRDPNSSINGSVGRRRKKRGSITGDYQRISQSPLTFGRSSAGRGIHLPSPFTLRIQQSDGGTVSKGNSLVPDEELCVGAVLNDSVLIVEDHTGRSVRLALSELTNVNKCEKKLELICNDKSNSGLDLGETKEGKSISVDDEITHVSLRIRFDGDKRAVSNQNDANKNQTGNVHNFILLISVLVVVASSVFLVKLSEELQGPVGIWAACMVVGTAILGLLAFLDGHTIRKSAEKATEKKDVWRIMYVALLDDSGEIAEHNQKKIEDKVGKWDFERMMDVMAIKKPTERPELCEHIDVRTETPQRWLNCEPDDAILARKRWQYTTKFRKTFGFNDILNRPHRLYDVIKKNWDSSYYGKDKTGKHPVFYDRPAGVNMNRMKQLGITDADLCYHYVWITEYCYKYLCDNSDDLASCITVYNLTGLDRSLFFGAKKKLLQKTMKIMEQHYPERTYKIYILNGPWWFNGLAFPMARGIASKATMDKIKNFDSDFTKFAEDLFTYVDKDKIPKQFGGSNTLEMTNSVVSSIYK
jgi:hypothetical protein